MEKRVRSIKCNIHCIRNIGHLFVDIVALGDCKSRDDGAMTLCSVGD